MYGFSIDGVPGKDKFKQFHIDRAIVLPQLEMFSLSRLQSGYLPGHQELTKESLGSKACPLT